VVYASVTQTNLHSCILNAGGASGGGFYTCDVDEDGRERNFKLNMTSRGRLIDSVDSFPPRMKEICLDCLKTAESIDPTLPPSDPDTLLINFYKTSATFKWHKDSEHPDLVRSGEGKPVVSFSIGLSASFGYKAEYEDDEHQSVRLNSGDVLIFGGPSRMICHR